MADFVFPPGGENVTVTAPNGITYVWDVDNQRWAIRSNSNKVSSICHVGVAAPGSSTEGDLWYDISDLNDKKLYINVNSVWEQAAPGWQEYQVAIDEAAKVFYGDDPPTDPSYELWYDTSLLELCVLHGGMWFPALSITQDIPTLQQVLQAGPPIASQDIVLTNAENDIIDMSVSEGRVVIGTMGEDLAPRFELRHKEGVDDSLALFEIDDAGKRLDIEAEGRIDNIHFKFGNVDKFILNKTGDAEFIGRVTVDPGREGHEVVTFQQLAEVEQSIDDLQPSLDHGEWLYQDLKSNTTVAGTYALFHYTGQQDYCNAVYSDCMIAAENETERAACATNLGQCMDNGVNEVLDVPWNHAGYFAVNIVDTNGNTHTLSSSEISDGDMIEIMNIDGDGYGVYEITGSIGSGALYKTWSVKHKHSQGVPSGHATIKFFKLFNPSDYYTKAEIDAMTQGSAGVSDVPIGTIVFWGGTIAKIPTGWEECRGQAAPQLVQDLTGRTNLPNLRDYMPAGVGGAFGTTLGNTVDSKIKSHNHSVQRLEPGNTTGNPDGSGDTSSSRYRYWRGNSNNSGSSGSQISKSTTAAGDSITAPPVYLGVYIMKVT